MSLFGPTLIGGGGSGGGQSSGPAPAQGGAAAPPTVDLRVSPDTNTLQVSVSSGPWTDTGVLLETTTDASGAVVSIGLRTS